MKRYGIERQTLLVALIPIVVMAVLLVNYFIYSRFADLDRGMMERSQLMANQLASSSEYAVFSGNETLLKQNVDALLTQQDVEAVEVFGAAAKPLMASSAHPRGYEDMAAKVSASVPVYQDVDVLLLYEPIAPTQIKLDELNNETEAASKPLGAIIIKVSKLRLNRQKREILLFNLLVTLSILMMTLALGLWAARRITRPIMGMSQAVRRIGEGALDTRISEQSDVHELSELAVGFNRMVQQLQLDRDTLEESIAEATRELREKKDEAEQAAEALGRESYTNKMLLRTASDGIYIFNVDGDVVQVSDAFCRMLGYTREEMMGMNVAQWNAQWSVAELRSRIDALGNINPMFETMHRRRDGRLIYVEISSARVEIGGRQLVFNSARDVTERKRVEDELRMSEERYRTLYRNTPVMLHSINHDGVLISVSNYWLSQMGYELDEVLGRKSTEFMTEASCRYANEVVLPAFMQTGMCSDVPYQMIRRDGTIMDVLLSAIAEKDDTGRVVRSLAVVVDITERKQIQAELQLAKERAELASHDKSRFLAAASHDLRQPMHALGLFVGQLRGKLTTAEQVRIVDQIEGSVDAMSNLLNGLLDISKLDAGMVVPTVQAFSLDPLLKRLAQDYAPVAANKDITLRVKLISSEVMSDPLLLERILLNLLNNALRYTPRHGRVLVACRKRGDFLNIEIRDNGIGISEADQKNIFREFFQVENAARDRDQGLGLGLAIVERLSRLLGHSVWLRSASGKGAMFVIEVPLTTVAAASAGDAAVTERLPVQSVVSETLLDGARLLLVDDDALVRASTEGILSAWGCAVSVAATLHEASMLCAEKEFDVLVCDYRLPDGTGLEVLVQAEHHCGKRVPAILISGDGAPEILQQVAAAGCYLLHKPVRPAKLRSLILFLLAEGDG
ncbi:MAG: PAS domain S-box protein [Nitrosomonadales bacterium]|nr:PAS domain S-box protein [Nitrosomonadales bacterium]